MRRLIRIIMIVIILIIVKYKKNQSILVVIRTENIIMSKGS